MVAQFLPVGLLTPGFVKSKGVTQFLPVGLLTPGFVEE